MSQTEALRRVLLYAHDTYGLGHLRRNLAIAAHLLATHPGLQVVLMTGSPVAGHFAIPERLTLVQLPPVVKVGVEEYRSHDDRWDIDLVRRTRSAIMVDTALRFRPNVLLVDHAPIGMKGELVPVYDALKTHSPSTRIVLGLRDVLDDPETVRQLWQTQRAYDALEDVFDRILVYGNHDLFDVVSSYGLSTSVASKLTYCGYVSRQLPGGAAPMREDFVLGTAGGGGDGVEALSATLAACAALGVACRIVTGPLMSATDRARLIREASVDPRASVTEFLPDADATMARARAAVTMGGYNSLSELVASATPTVVVPRIYPRREQAIRAELFAARGAVAVVSPGADLARRIYQALRGAIDQGPRTGPSPIDLGGLAEIERALDAEARLGRTRDAAAHTSVNSVGTPA